MPYLSTSYTILHVSEATVEKSRALALRLTT